MSYNLTVIVVITPLVTTHEPPSRGLGFSKKNQKPVRAQSREFLFVSVRV